MWSRLVLWVDLNHNGISENSELTPIQLSHISAISLDYHLTNRRDRSGNTFRYEALVVFEGSPRPFYDIYFVSEP